jgi:hypothetical protein
VSLVAEERECRECAVDVFGDLRETCVMEAVEFSPEIWFGKGGDVEFIKPEVALTESEEGFKVKDKCLVGLAGFEEVSVDLRNLAGITSHVDYNFYHFIFKSHF